LQTIRAADDHMHHAPVRLDILTRPIRQIAAELLRANMVDPAASRGFPLFTGPKGERGIWVRFLAKRLLHPPPRHRK